MRVWGGGGWCAETPPPYPISQLIPVDFALVSYSPLWYSVTVSVHQACLGSILTINVPLFKKLRDIIFFAGQSLYEPFQGTF